jgi:hypothetical protein
MYILVVSLANRFYNPLLGLKDLFYFLLPVQFLLGMAFFNTVFQARPVLARVFVKFCAGFLIFQLVVVIAEFVSFGPLLTILRPYLQWFLLNTSSTDAQLGYLNLRPSGTLGNPVLLGVAAYIIGRFVSHAQQKPTYFLVGLSLVILTASRTAALAIIVAEGVAFALRPSSPLRVTPRQIRNTGLAALLILGVVVVMFATIPFMRAYLEIIRSGGFAALSDDYSVTYRNQILGWALGQPERLMFGGLSLAEAPDAVDSEVLMRSLQFGILGYFALQVPVWSLLLWGVQTKSAILVRYAVAMLVFCGICSTTFSPFSNPYFVIWYAAIAGYWCGVLKPGREGQRNDSDLSQSPRWPQINS